MVGKYDEDQQFCICTNPLTGNLLWMCNTELCKKTKRFFRRTLQEQRRPPDEED